MHIKKTLAVDGVQFDFQNNLFNGEEEFSVNGEVLSKKKSQFGGSHEFSYDGNDYVIKVKPGLGRVGFKVEKNGQKVDALIDGDPLNPLAHILCGWPLILIFFGGAVGGGLGGLAYGVNVCVYKAEIPKPIKVITCISTGLAAVILWSLVAAMIYQSMG